MEAISTLKEISQLVKKYNDLELMGKIVNLQTEVFGLSQENLELKRKLETSREKAEQREKLQLRRVGECNYYFMDGDEVPFCPKCYEDKGKLAHLTNSEPWDGGVRRDCRICNEAFYEVPMDLTPRRITVRRSW